MNHLRGAFLLVAAAFVQWWWSTHFAFWGLSPQIPLVLTVAIAARQGPAAAMGYGFVWGLCLDSLRPELFGANALVFTLIGYGTGTVRKQIDLADMLSQCVAVVMMTWGYFLMYGMLGLIFAKSFIWVGWAAFICDPFYNCLLVPFGAGLWFWLRARP
ncbi:MAG: rod shape-determining protein MreD [Elusimicrobiota bacterium]|jgi:rod shape-determining protein MreD